MPVVTVVIPTYNMEEYLPEALESVLQQQGFDDYEILICDDASTDGTEHLCRVFKDPRVRYKRFEHGGQALTANRGIERAQGEYITILAADDMLEPSHLARAMGVLNNSPRVGLLHCSVQHVDAGGSPFFLQKLYDEDRIDEGEVLLRRLVLEGCVVNPAGVVVRRSAYARAGGFTERVIWGIDWHMWMRVVLHDQAAYLAEPLAKYRHHGTSGTSSVIASGRYAADELWLMQDILPLIERYRPNLGHIREVAFRRVAHRTWCHAEEACRSGDGRAARVGITRAIKIDPWLRLQPRVWGLWLASFAGYRWFARLVQAKHVLLQASTAIKRVVRDVGRLRGTS